MDEMNGEIQDMGKGNETDGPLTQEELDREISTIESEEKNNA